MWNEKKVGERTWFSVEPNGANPSVLEHQLEMQSYELLIKPFIDPDDAERRIILFVEDGKADYRVIDTTPEDESEFPHYISGFYVAQTEDSPMDEFRRGLDYIETEMLPKLPEWPEGVPDRRITVTPIRYENEQLTEEGYTADVTLRLDVVEDRYCSETAIWESVLWPSEPGDHEKHSPGQLVKRLTEIVQLGFKERLTEGADDQEWTDLMKLTDANEKLMYVAMELADEPEPDYIECEKGILKNVINRLFLKGSHLTDILRELVYPYHRDIQREEGYQPLEIKLENVQIVEQADGYAF